MFLFAQRFPAVSAAVARTIFKLHDVRASCVHSPHRVGLRCSISDFAAAPTGSIENPWAAVDNSIMKFGRATAGDAPSRPNASIKPAPCAYLEGMRNELIIRLRGAADLPQRLVVERIRPLWKQVLREDEVYDGIDELRTALSRAGSAGEAVLVQLPTELSRYPLTDDSMKAAATLHKFARWPPIMRSAFKYLRYADANEAKGDIRWLATQQKLSAKQTRSLVAAVDLWFPVYRWADGEVCSRGWA